MIRYSLFALTVLATAATAIAAVAPSRADLSGNLTVIEKNQAFPVYGRIVTEDCAREDCSDVQN